MNPVTIYASRFVVASMSAMRFLICGFFIRVLLCTLFGSHCRGNPRRTCCRPLYHRQSWAVNEKEPAPNSIQRYSKAISTSVAKRECTKLPHIDTGMSGELRFSTVDRFQAMNGTPRNSQARARVGEGANGRCDSTSRRLASYRSQSLFSRRLRVSSCRIGAYSNDVISRSRRLLLLTLCIATSVVLISDSTFAQRKTSKRPAPEKKPAATEPEPAPGDPQEELERAK